MRLRDYLPTLCLIVSLLPGASLPGHATESSGQAHSVGCTIVDDSKASVYLSVIGPVSAISETDRTLRIVNNSSCDIYLLTNGRQSIVRSGRLEVYPDKEIVENAVIVPMFRANTRERPWEFEISWKGGDAYSILTLKAGSSARFFIPRRYLSGGRRIVVPYGYTWEPKWSPLLQHWVLSP